MREAIWLTLYIYIHTYTHVSVSVCILRGATLETTFDMTILIFSSRGCPSLLVLRARGGPATANPPYKVASKDLLSWNPPKWDQELKVDCS